MEFGQRKIAFLGGVALALVVPAVMGLGADAYAPPPGYYLAVEGLSGTALRDALHERIRNHEIILYSSLTQAFRATDVDPDNPSNLIMIYSGQSMPTSALGTSGATVWNREHLWPQSWGADIGAANSDIHHIFPCNGEVNEKRSNYFFDWTDPANLSRVLWNGQDLAPGSTYDPVRRTFEPRDADKGRVARAMFYMATRYDGRDPNSYNFLLSNWPSSTSTTKTFAYLDALLAWNRMFAPDERERRRNHLIFDGARVGNIVYRQGNRNPFIDAPEWVDAIYLPASTVTYGTWRWRHFSFAELQDPAISGDLADPDGDGVPNLIEFSANLDPRTVTVNGLPRFFRAADGSAFLSFRRLRHYADSGLEYRIEHTRDPLLEREWAPIAYTDEDLQIAPGELTDLVSAGDYLLPPSADPYWLRLRVVRHWPLNNPGEALAEPFRSADWQLSGWLGRHVDAAFPFVYSAAGWLFFADSSRASVRLWHPEAGWLLTTTDLFPIAYRPATGAWTVLSQAFGDLRLYDFATAQWNRP